MLASLRPLRSRNFAVIWTSALVSNVGSWMQTVALGVVVTTRSHNPLWTGAVAAGELATVGGRKGHCAAANELPQAVTQ